MKLYRVILENALLLAFIFILRRSKSYQKEILFFEYCDGLAHNVRYKHDYFFNYCIYH